MMMNRCSSNNDGQEDWNWCAASNKSILHYDSNSLPGIWAVTGVCRCHKRNRNTRKLKSMFNTLYIHFSNSAVRKVKLQVQKIFEDKDLKIKEPHAVHWLSLRSAVEAVNRCYSSTVATLAKLGISNCIAKSLHKYFNNTKNALLTSFILDMHNEIAGFSCDLQKDNLIFSEVMPLLESTQAKLMELKKAVNILRKTENLEMILA